MKIPFFNLSKENLSIKNELCSSVLSVIESGSYILGNELLKFEKKYAEYIGTKYCIGVGNGLDALILILRSLDIKQDDEVIVPAHTFIATWLAVSQVGARIIPVEPDDSFNIEIAKIEKKITSKTKAIIPVHLYGRPVDMSALREIANRHSIYVIEDSAQAHGASINKVKCGNLGDAAAFSFYPVKNLGSFGDAGAITTNNKNIAQKILSLRNYGSTKKYVHQTLGVNSRLDEIQSAVLSVKLSQLDKCNNLKEKIANKYLTKISNDNIILPPPQRKNTFVAWHQFVLKVNKRSKFIKYMNEKGIETMIHYPTPPHESPAYKEKVNKFSLPLTSEICESIVSLPIYSTLSNEEVNYIINSINQYE